MSGGIDLRRSLMGSLAFSPTFGMKTRFAASLLDGLVSANLSQMRAGGLAKGRYPIISGIHSGTVRYRRSDPQEHWQSWEELLRQTVSGDPAYGDCEDLAASVAAELLYNDIEARTYTYKAAPGLYHVVVATKRWGLIDPSIAAGMEGAA